jgi:hypothetical protein
MCGWLGNFRFRIRRLSSMPTGGGGDPHASSPGLGDGVLLHHHADGQNEWQVALLELGTIVLDSGELVVADPYISEPDTPAFTRRFASGEHQVILGIAQIADDHRRIACAVLLGSELPIRGWQLALHPGQLLDDLEGEDSFFGFPVDAGTACLASPSAFAVAAQVLAADAGMLEDPLSAARFWAAEEAAIAEPSEGSSPVAVLTSGWGDGVYPTWFGIDAEDGIAVAVVDFLLNSDEPPPDDPNQSSPPPAPDAEDDRSLWARLRRRRRHFRRL